MGATLEEAVTPTDADARLAKESAHTLAPHQGNPVTLKLAREGGAEQVVELPASAVQLLVRILTEMGNGNAVTLVPIQAELTTQQAADLLGVSRPFFIKLLEEGRLPYRLVGAHRRVGLSDLLTFDRQDRAQRLEAARELTALSQKMGLY